MRWGVLLALPLLSGCEPCRLCFGGGPDIQKISTITLAHGSYSVYFSNACGVMDYATLPDGRHDPNGYDIEITDMVAPCSTVSRSAADPLTLADRANAYEAATTQCRQLLRGINPDSKPEYGVLFAEAETPYWYFPGVCSKVLAN